MRFLLRCKIPTEAGNKLVRDPNFGKMLEDYITRVKPEAVYMVEDGGDRGMIFVVDIPSADMLPIVTEPLWQGFNAKVEIRPAMVPDDLKKALPKLKL